MQRAHAFAVESEILRARRRGHEGEAKLSEETNGISIFLNAVAKALICHVNQGKEILFRHDLSNLTPFLMGKIKPGRIVAAAMEEHQRLGRKCLERLDHGIKIHRRAVSRKVRILADRETVSLENRNVIAPGRIRYDGFLNAQELMRKRRAQLQCAGAAQRLDSGNRAGGNCRMILAENELLHGLTIGGEPRHRHVSTRLMTVRHSAFGLFDHLKERHLARFVQIHADAEIDLIGKLIGLIETDETENGIVRHGGESGNIVLKHLMRPCKKQKRAERTVRRHPAVNCANGLEHYE